MSKTHIFLTGKNYENLKQHTVYLYLSFDHNLVRHLSIVFAVLGLAVRLLIAEQPQSLGALQLNLKLLAWKQEDISVKIRTRHTIHTHYTWNATGVVHDEQA